MGELAKMLIGAPNLVIPPTQGSKSFSNLNTDELIEIDQSLLEIKLGELQAELTKRPEIEEDMKQAGLGYLIK